MVPPAEALSVAFCAVVTAETVAVNPAVEAPEGTVTDPGTVTALSLLDRLTASPPVPATAVRVTVQASLPAAVKALWLQEIELRAGLDELDAAPLPCSLIFSDGLVVEVLETVSCPVESPFAFGLNCNARL